MKKSELTANQNTAIRNAPGLHLIGMLYDNPSINYINNVQTGALTACRRRDCHLIVEKIDLTTSDIRTAIGNLVSTSQLDGVVLTPPVCDNRDILGIFNETRTPFVCIAPNEPSSKALSVQMDDYKAAYDLTKYLLSLGHERIGFIKGHPKFTVSQQRYQGYCDALQDNNLKIDDEIIKQGYFSHHSGMVCGEALLKDARLRPTAIFCSNDDMAAATIAVAHKLNISVPNDVSIVGFDDTAIASLTWPQLTTVRQPIIQMAEIAIELLVRNMRPEKIDADENRIKLDFEIIIRKSTTRPNSQR